MKNLILPLIVVLILSVDLTGQEHKILNLFDESSHELTFSSVRYVPLSTGTDHLLGGGRSVVRLHQGEIFIYDQNERSSILRFDNSGDFINAIGRPGRGAEEYVQLKDFTLDNNQVYVLDGNGNNGASIKVYTTDDLFIESLNTNMAINSMELIPGGFIVNTGFNKPMYSCRYYIVDEQGVCRDSLLKNNTMLDLPMQEQNFSRSGEQVYVHEAFDQKVYVYSDGSLKVTYELDFGKYNIPSSFYQKSLMEGFMKLNEQGFPAISQYFENNHLAVFELMIQQQGKETQVYHLVYDKQIDHSVLRSFTVGEESEEIYQTLVGLTDEDELVYLIYPVNFIDQLDKLPGLRKVEADDNPILAFCKISW